jgi:putative acyl-CoA dehydrogenase
MATHEVTNQVPDFVGHDLFATDPVLVDAIQRWGDARDADDLGGLGRLANAEPTQAHADRADRHTPILRTHDRTGRRIDEVDYDPSYHWLMARAIAHGLTAEAWTRPTGSGAHLRRAVGFHLWSQAEAGHLCPISMTYAAAPALRSNPTLAAEVLPRIASRHYDSPLAPLATKSGATMGMGMTEKQGGSDVRANTTVAVPDGDVHRLTGHKWFCSAPMSDAFLVLANTESGSSCFFVPRVLPDGERNHFAVQRLKDKLGNRSNASSEVEFEGTVGTLVGEEGRGIRTIIDMVASTRLDCVLGSAAGMRAALTRAIWHARHRSAFGARLVDQPLMQNVLADLALESEAATLLGLRLAAAVDHGDTDVSRLGVAVGKFWVCKRTPPVVAEALECLGGAGYVEENGLARLYREAPLNSIWEGSGNVNALDVVRALTRQPAALAALGKELALARGHSTTLDAAIDRVESAHAEALGADAQLRARRLVEHLAITLQAALLVQHSPAIVADAFVASRLGGEHGHTFGTLSGVSAAHAGALVDRAFLPA